MEILVLVLAAALAFANGANDNSKGVATLVGQGAASARRALVWAALTTGLGAGVGFLAGGALVRAFRAGFVTGDAPLSTSFFAAVLAGAVAWVAVATATGLPVSTTHAIAGGLLGAGLVQGGLAGIGWSELMRRIAIPLAISPLAALALVRLGSPLMRLVARRVEPSCLCAVERPEPLLVGLSETAAAASRLALVAGTRESCPAHGTVAAVGGGSLLAGLHWSTSGLVGFARGWNDAPKIAALALVALPAGWGAGSAFGLVAAAMAAGGLLAGRRVLRTLAHRITELPLGESLAASGVSSLLVALASWRGLPVSTTHVTTGGIVGAGLARDSRLVEWRVVREVGLSWLVTLPAAAAVSAVSILLLRWAPWS